LKNLYPGDDVTPSDFAALAPLLILGGSTVAVMLIIALRRNYTATVMLTLIGLCASFRSLWTMKQHLPQHVTPLLVMDRYALFYIGLIVAATIAIVLISYAYFKKAEGDNEEVYILLLAATLGASVLVAANHFASFFLGLELLSVSLYGMISYIYVRPLSVEAGIKYLVLAAVSAAFLLFGMALVYMAAGTMEFGRIAALMSAGKLSRELMLPGLALIITGFGFKLALVPFHFWTPDVYQGAPAPVAAYVATVSKGAMFALLLRFIGTSAAHIYTAVPLIFTIIAISSMFAGNILALFQNNVKRILAYSSIAHLGYILVAFLAGGQLGALAVTFYLVAYFITILGAFGVVTVLSSGNREAENLEDYRGLFWRRPALATVFTVMLLSLAGIPITAGFIGKFYILTAGASASIWALIIILVITSAIGLFYYLRVIVVLYGDGSTAPAATYPLAPLGNVVLGLLTAVLLLFGVFPAPLLNLIRTVISDLT
jgi:NADH-quinone oxidoreductase subunit N